LLNTREQHHQTEQEIKNLQEDEKESTEYNNNNLLPPMQKLTETVNFLKKGRNVADTLWSAHILEKSSICQESTMQNNLLSF